MLWATLADAKEPVSSRVANPARVTASVQGPCHAQLATELGRGVSGDGCSEQRRTILRQLGRKTQWGPGFGVVERATPTPTGLSLLLAAARGCTLWPVRDPARTVLNLYDAKVAGCSVRRYQGPMVVRGIHADGRTVDNLEVLQVDGGRVEVDLVNLAVQLDRQGLRLDEFTRLEFGRDGWAGQLELAPVLAMFADRHAAAVLRGRGVPGLWMTLHPNHRAADAIGEAALKASLQRQELDLEAVKRGVMTPRRFLQRHVWSPYRPQVEAMETHE